ncbi:electron transport complex protein RnfG [Candidatus Termititenax aidoneus]|uniref:Ion-translocating oxidoreductase complex subunit G n=1 Tax=Termititenax aidoneus TaxID=2218524 RepID=A0A388TDF9_TERA1|nr:electron transport complex protein RnfG [Candidatus Termititenax aidoneus]
MGKLVKLILKYALILAVFCGVAGLLLALVYERTAPLKILNQAKAKIAGQQKLFPELAKIMDGEVYAASGELLGYILSVRARGYSSEIELLVGLDPVYRISGLQVLAQAETPGLGARITEKSFVDRLLGHAADSLRHRKDGGTQDGITGATITSRAVFDGVRQEVENFKKSKGAE